MSGTAGQPHVSGSLQCPKGVPEVTGVVGSLQCMRIGFMVTTTLDAQLALSVKPVPLGQEVKQK